MRKWSHHLIIFDSFSHPGIELENKWWHQGQTDRSSFSVRQYILFLFCVTMCWSSVIERTWLITNDFTPLQNALTLSVSSISLGLHRFVGIVNDISDNRREFDCFLAWKLFPFVGLSQSCCICLNGMWLSFLLKGYKKEMIRKWHNQKENPTPKTEVGKNTILTITYLN